MRGLSTLLHKCSCRCISNIRAISSFGRASMLVSILHGAADFDLSFIFLLMNTLNADV